MCSTLLDGQISNLEIDLSIISILNDNGVYTVNDLWHLKRKDLKKFSLADNQINQIIIKMQLYGIDLNRRSYHEN